MPGGAIVVSEEASDYRPEMEWLARRLSETRKPAMWSVRDTSGGEGWPSHVYRFFELFDLPNIACGASLMEGVREGRLSVTPPFKPALEEKLWFALFWMRPLEAFWVRALGGRTLAALREVIPYTWLVNPQPLPPHAVLPGLEVHDWKEVAAFTQKQRELILKVSGFSPRAWGSRGVVAAFDLPSHAWAGELGKALDDWPHAPHILQRFHHPALVEHPYLQGNEIRMMRGRVRLCPYYFVAEGGPVTLGGALATICPDDKKLLHGMPDAILCPAGAGGES
jgi:hypothetical protein